MIWAVKSDPRRPIDATWSASDIPNSSPRFWKHYGLQIWDLTIPLGALALLILFVRSIVLWDDVGLAFVVGLGPMIAELTLEGIVPSYEAWASIPGNRDLLSGIVIAALLTVPIWLVVQAMDEKRSEAAGRESLDRDLGAAG